MKIGITGGAGFIGSNLAEHLCLKGHEVYVFDNLESGSKENLLGIDCKFVEGDLREKESIQTFLDRHKIEHLVHLGALGSVPRSIKHPRASFESNALATLNVLEAIRNLEISLTFSSSSSVYGKNSKLPKSEIDWLSPLSPYAASKLAAEGLCLAYKESYKLNILVYRLFNVFGPRQNANSIYSAVIPKWIIAAFKKEPLVVFGNGQQRRDFTFIEDVVEILGRPIDKSTLPQLPVNLAFGNPVTLNYILDVFREYFGDILISYEDVRHGDIKDSEANPESLLKLHEGKLLHTSIESGLLKTFEWFKSKYSF